ncbi:hypothetical protein [Streptomyces reniochalinae]|nr:hypothetical protein [Streptomyces reniochalinae]
MGQGSHALYLSVAVVCRPPAPPPVPVRVENAARGSVPDTCRLR